MAEWIYNNTTSIPMQPRTPICTFSFLLSSQHVSAPAGHHQVLPFMLKLSNCIAYHFCLVLLSITNVHHMKKTTPTHWWRKWRTAGANITKTVGRVEHNHTRTTAGLYNTNKKGTSGWRLVRGKDFKNTNKNKNKFWRWSFKDFKQNNFNEYNKTIA
jgi:hypothetical protein